MRRLTPWTTMLVSSVLVPIATIAFAVGFFPYKPYFTGMTSRPTADPPPAPFDRLILMVVDSLRSDFVYSHNSGMNYTHSLIRSGNCIPFTARASAPTVTMPKIKAITTGSVPSYLDVILNIASDSSGSASLEGQDSWLAQLRRHHYRPDGDGQKLVMFGDDTWLKLFPDIFDRADGTTSFFASDFTEVDNNVTRHLDRELDQHDWAVMVLHYLGLDHIGHKSGSTSVHMKPKQIEMDDIVRRIFTTIQSDNRFNSTILVMLGDHGMTDEGNHGGSSSGETSPALLFASPKLATLSNAAGSKECPIDHLPDDRFGFYDRIDQADLVPTISALLGLPIPKNNAGVLATRLLGLWDHPDRLRLVRENGIQLMKLARAKFTSLSATAWSRKSTDDCDRLQIGDRLACLWRRALSSDRQEHYVEFSQEAKAELSRAASDYKPSWMICAIVAVVISAALAASSVVPLASASSRLDAAWWAFVVTGHAVTAFASSFVEKEGDFWYFIAASSVVIALVGSSSSTTPLSTRTSAAIGLLVLHRLSGSWSHIDSLTSRFPAVLWTAVGATYLFHVGRAGPAHPAIAAGRALSFISIGLFKLVAAAQEQPELIQIESLPVCFRDRIAVWLATNQSVHFGQVAWTTIAISTVAILILQPRDSTTLSTLITPVVMMQTRLGLTPLIGLIIPAQVAAMSILTGPTPDSFRLSVLAGLAFPHSIFFSVGGSNGIATVDLSQGYNGLADFRLGSVATLVFVANWAGPITWLIERQRMIKPGPAGSSVAVLHSLAGAVVMAASMIASFAMRNHLFVWSVFSPRFLYAAVWAVGYHSLGVMTSAF